MTILAERLPLQILPAFVEVILNKLPIVHVPFCAISRIFCYKDNEWIDFILLFKQYLY